jgi:hypothetical protein
MGLGLEEAESKKIGITRGFESKEGEAQGLSGSNSCGRARGDFRTEEQREGPQEKKGEKKQEEGKRSCIRNWSRSACEHGQLLEKAS